MTGPCPHASPSLARILDAVAARYQVRATEIVSHRRPAYVVRPRHVAFFLARELTPKSLPQIGRFFGDRDHTTVLAAVRKIEAARRADAALAAEIAALEAEIERGGAAA